MKKWSVLILTAVLLAATVMPTAAYDLETGAEGEGERARYEMMSAMEIRSQACVLFEETVEIAIRMEDVASFADASEAGIEEGVEAGKADVKNAAFQIIDDLIVQSRNAMTSNSIDTTVLDTAAETWEQSKKTIRSRMKDRTWDAYMEELSITAGMEKNEAVPEDNGYEDAPASAGAFDCTQSPLFGPAAEMLEQMDPETKVLYLESVTDACEGIWETMSDYLREAGGLDTVARLTGLDIGKSINYSAAEQELTEFLEKYGEVQGYTGEMNNLKARLGIVEYKLGSMKLIVSPVNKILSYLK